MSRSGVQVLAQGMIHAFRIGDKPMSPLLQEILKQAEQLSPADRQELIQRLSQKQPASDMKPKWSDLKGMAPYPMMGEDAQEWVSRTRQEGDDQREQALRGK